MMIMSTTITVMIIIIIISKHFSPNLSLMVTETTQTFTKIK